MRISDWSSDVCSSDLTALKVWRGDATLRATGLTRPQSKLLLRSAFIGLTALSILLMPWLGFNLAVMLFLLSGMLLLGVRKVKPLVIIPLAAGSVGYLLFHDRKSVVSGKGVSVRVD